ncbi:hypothetical protein C7T35_10375 [Variovorax sp. WS11]|uniref:hypothetical protein n=1 Tax=Variovorax sp. WS11 TaxID=1105204 RepID=UPI000D0CF7BC|nr:hypothetical protein [Variovorax sp. WS11]NDZ12757.1 hypothetical protein [Variovorax sp. WS11]PSL84694.1 hypothetical protein C7T35_10375 [Variovorax sp. WS11]
MQSATGKALANLEAALGAQLIPRIGRTLLAGSVSLMVDAAELQAVFFTDQQAPPRIAASSTAGEYLLPDRAALEAGQPAGTGAADHRIIGNGTYVIASVGGSSRAGKPTSCLRWPQVPAFLVRDHLSESVGQRWRAMRYHGNPLAETRFAHGKSSSEH